MLKKIYDDLVESWRVHIVLTPPCHAVRRAVADGAWDEDATIEDYENADHTYVKTTRFSNPDQKRGYENISRLGIHDRDSPEVAFSLVGEIEFPPKKDLNKRRVSFAKYQTQ
jgi:hypothetical protein